MKNKIKELVKENRKFSTEILIFYIQQYIIARRRKKLKRLRAVNMKLKCRYQSTVQR